MQAAAPFLIFSPFLAHGIRFRLERKGAMEIACQTVRHANSGPFPVRSADHEAPSQARTSRKGSAGVHQYWIFSSTAFLISTFVPKYRALVLAAQRITTGEDAARDRRPGSARRECQVMPTPKGGLLLTRITGATATGQFGHAPEETVSFCTTLFARCDATEALGDHSRSVAFHRCSAMLRSHFSSRSAAHRIALSRISQKGVSPGGRAQKLATLTGCVTKLLSSLECTQRWPRHVSY